MLRALWMAAVLLLAVVPLSAAPVGASKTVVVDHAVYEVASVGNHFIWDCPQMWAGIHDCDPTGLTGDGSLDVGGVVYQLKGVSTVQVAIVDDLHGAGVVGGAVCSAPGTNWATCGGEDLIETFCGTSPVINVGGAERVAVEVFGPVKQGLHCDPTRAPTGTMGGVLDPAGGIYVSFEGGSGMEVVRASASSDGYDEDENKICLATDPGWIADTDGDGTVDCLDPDEDGDGLTDKFEDRNTGYNRSKADSDGDGTEDPFDIRPLDGLPGWQVTAWDYDTPFEGDKCEGALQKYPDPYITFFYLTLKDGPDHQLVIPTGWTKDNHVDDREPGVVSDLTVNSLDGDAVVNGIYPIPNDIREFGTTDDGEAPRITVSIEMKDHDDDLDGDDRMLLDGTDKRAELSTSLLSTSPSRQSSQGNEDDCWGMIEFSMPDNVRDLWLCVAYHNYVDQDEDELVRTDTELQCPTN